MENNDIKVSVLCTAYNHEPFIEKCILNIVQQKTNFKFELIINDDCSTDKTREIIKKYKKIYPDIIVPIFQKENQYSKGVAIVDDIIFPISKGKYIAICEGDDYWCDENKLQLQYDFMEKNKDCITCYHNTVFQPLNDISSSRKFNDWKDVHYLTPKEIINECCVHTSSFFTRREHFQKPDWVKKYWFGDYVRKTLDLYAGKLVCLPQTMSVYNAGNPNGAMERLHNNDDKQLKYNKLMTQVDYLEKYNDFTNQKYKDLVEAEIFNCEKCALNVLYRDDVKTYRKGLKEHKYLKKFLKQSNLKTRIKMFVILHSPLWLYKLLIDKRRRKNGGC